MLDAASLSGGISSHRMLPFSDAGPVGPRDAGPVSLADWCSQTTEIENIKFKRQSLCRLVTHANALSSALPVMKPVVAATRASVPAGAVGDLTDLIFHVIVCGLCGCLEPWRETGCFIESSRTPRKREQTNSYPTGKDPTNSFARSDKASTRFK